MSQETVYKIPLKHDEEIIFSVKEFKGNTYFDMRIYFQSKEDGSQLPSKKGLTVNIGLLEEFKSALGRVSETLEKEVVGSKE